MADKKSAIVVLLVLIISCIALIMAWSARSSGPSTSGTELKELSDRLALLEAQVNSVKPIEVPDFSDEGENGAGTGNPEPAPNPEPTPAPAQPTPAKKSEYVTVSEGVNLRSDPSTSAAVVRKLPKGAKLKDYGQTKSFDGHEWVQVTDDGNRLGWVVKSFIQ